MKLLYPIIFLLLSCSTEPQDCAGVSGGSAIIDDCGLCTGGTTELLANYLKDCTGICGGDAEEDCLGECNGTAMVDNCGTCDADASNDCTQDCAGVWGGLSYLDECGDCDANVNNDGFMDECGVCDTDAINDCLQDCTGVWGGESVISGCDNTCNSTKEFDNCGVCDGDNLSCGSFALYPDITTIMQTDSQGNQLDITGSGIHGACYENNLYRLDNEEIIPPENNSVFVFPNPCQESNSIYLNIANAMEIKLLIIDKNNDIIETIFEGFKEAGSHSFSLITSNKPAYSESDYFRIIADFGDYECFENIYVEVFE